jgi:hypothetical protein
MRRLAVLGGLLSLVVVPGGLAASQRLAGWLTYGGDESRVGYTAPAAGAKLHRLWRRHLDGIITSQVLGADTDAGRRLFVGTSAGSAYALDDDGRTLWRARLGRLVHSCPQLDSWGVVGTGAVDGATNALYVADSFGRLHALDLSTGAERAGWPVRMYSDYRSELVWGAIAIVHGVAYVGTGSFCDRAMEGKVVSVDLATRAVSTWISVPAAKGGGGGIWGWGGVAYERSRDSLLVATGNAYYGGSNTGRRFRETAGFGEQVVELSPTLEVRAHSHPTNVGRRGDFDFVGSPVPFARPGCGEVVAAFNKNGNLYVWRAGRLDDGTITSLHAAHSDAYDAVVSQLAYSPRTHALYLVTNYRLIRIDVSSRCRARVRWRRRLGAGLFNSSPTIAGGILWYVRTADVATLLGVDARTGRVKFHEIVGSPVYAAPTVLGRAIYAGTGSGDLDAFELR